MEAILFLLCGWLERAESIPVFRADVVELNHFYDENGKHVFDQIIWWDWNDQKCRHEIVHWILRKKVLARQGNDVLWAYSSDKPVLTKAKSFSETWTQYDPEIRDRDFLPKDKRRGFRTEPYKKK